MTLGWPWPILRQGQIWLHRLLYGRKWKLFFFGTYRSLRSQSCLKHSAKWGYEVEWVSKVKVILWPWSKVTQIAKLNVWLLVCILRWAIQGLLVLLFCISTNLFSSFLFKCISPAYKRTFISVNHITCNIGYLKQTVKTILQLSWS